MLFRSVESRTNSEAPPPRGQLTPSPIQRSRPLYSLRIGPSLARSLSRKTEGPKYELFFPALDKARTAAPPGTSAGYPSPSLLTPRPALLLPLPFLFPAVPPPLGAPSPWNPRSGGGVSRSGGDGSSLGGGATCSRGAGGRWSSGREVEEPSRLCEFGLETKPRRAAGMAQGRSTLRGPAAVSAAGGW